ncbi:protoporphyrinogen oxidase [Planctomycetota bacterium]|nr:protoporphyrinogen oxidase [Planctomycetota bacterium]
MLPPPAERRDGRAKRLIVIGAGIGGLATAFRLGQRLPTAQITVIDAASRPGGVIASTRRDGFLLEHGPDSLVTNKPAGMRLVADLGLTDRLVGIQPAARSSLIARGDRLIPVPQGLYLLAPGKILPFLRSPVLSWPGKLRLAWDLFLPRRPAGAPAESLARFVRRRLGREALERIAQPLIAGITTADPERLSVAATFPQFLEMEQQHGSLIRAMIHRQRTSGQDAAGPRYGLFASFPEGIQELTDALVRRISPTERDDGERIMVNTAVRSVFPTDRGWRVATAAGDHDCDGVVIAAPAHTAARLLTGDRALPELLRTIPAAGVAVVNLAYNDSEIPCLPQAAGFVVPAIEQPIVRGHGAPGLIACTIASAKYPGRAPAGQVLLRGFLGGALHEAVLHHDDAELLALVRRDLRRWLGITATPLFTVIDRWPRSMAQPTIDGGGHLARVAAIRAAEAARPGLSLVGNGFEGVGIGDLSLQAERAADRLAAALSATA